MPDLNDRIYPDQTRLPQLTELRMHIYRYNWALQHTLPGGKTLDAGCGAGYGARMLSFTSAKVIAIDREESAITHAKLHFPSEKIDYRVGEILDLQETNFDTVVAFEMLEHNLDSEEIFKHLMSKLKAGGKGIFSLPVNSNAAGHQRIFTKQEINTFFENQNGHIFFQNLGDPTSIAPDNPLIVIALINKR